jgi:hypothetical protein
MNIACRIKKNTPISCKRMMRNDLYSPHVSCFLIVCLFVYLFVSVCFLFRFLTKFIQTSNTIGRSRQDIYRRRE